jgi:hypothetical protein
VAVVLVRLFDVILQCDMIIMNGGLKIRDGSCCDYYEVLSLTCMETVKKKM